MTERIPHRGLTEYEIEVLSAGIAARLQEAFGRRLATLEFDQAATPYPRWAAKWGWQRLVELAEAAEAIVAERTQVALREAERRARLAREPKPRPRGRLVYTLRGFREIGAPVKIGPR